MLGRIPWSEVHRPVAQPFVLNLHLRTPHRPLGGRYIWRSTNGRLGPTLLWILYVQTKTQTPHTLAHTRQKVPILLWGNRLFAETTRREGRDRRRHTSVYRPLSILAVSPRKAERAPLRGMDCGKPGAV